MHVCSCGMTADSNNANMLDLCLVLTSHLTLINSSRRHFNPNIRIVADSILQTRKQSRVRQILKVYKENARMPTVNVHVRKLCQEYFSITPKSK